MVTLNVKIPALNEKFYQDKQIPLIQKKLDKIDSEYGNLIEKISDMVGVNAELIKSFIFIESGGDPNAETPYAIGLMQVAKAAASDTIVYEKSSGRLSSAEESLLKKYLGSRWNKLDKLKKNQKSIGETFITKKDLLNTEFNILVGSMLLKQLIDEFADNGVARLDKVAVIYNTGKFSKIGKVAANHIGTAQDLAQKIPKGQGDYIRKLVGVNSTLDLLV